MLLAVRVGSSTIINEETLTLCFDGYDFLSTFSDCTTFCFMIGMFGMHGSFGIFHSLLFVGRCCCWLFRQFDFLYSPLFSIAV
jgi:hypothetical protein